MSERSKEKTGRSKGPLLISALEERRLLVLVLGVAVCGSLAKATGTPLFNSADEIGHFDYAYQVWHGQLPDFWAGPVVSQAHGAAMPVQWVSQHPPLFYLVQAPFIGPLTDSGHVLIGGMLARLVNVVIGVLVPLVSWWGLKRAFPGDQFLVFSGSLVMASSPWLFNTSGEIYNDALATLFVTSVFVVVVDTVTSGTKRWTWPLLAFLAVGAFLTRLSAGVLAVVLFGVMTIESFVRGAQRNHCGRWSGLLYSVLIGLAVLVSSGWFYLRNYRLSGSITGGHPEWGQEHLGRTVRSVADVLLDGETWPSLLNLYTAAPKGILGSVALLFLVVCPMGMSLTHRIFQIYHRQLDARTIAVYLLAWLVIAIVVAMQIVYSTSGGALNPRYLLPVLLPVSGIVADGIQSIDRIKYVLLSFWLLLWGVLEVRSFFSPQVIRSDFPALPTFSLLFFLAMLVSAVTAFGYGLRLARR
ncbi:MAG: hypothetical protein LKK46_07890 [Ancrocorticia sp.]|nr:hypothetical protein [Ancrocorticia sp.]MCI2194025.1 hypothetical protein [Ancrocorticia sp.]